MSIEAIGVGCFRMSLLLAVLAAAQAQPPKATPPSAPATSAPQPTGVNDVSNAKAPGDASAPSYKSPKEAGDAFVAATAKKDWKATFRCFAADAQDLLVVQVLANCEFSASRAGKEKEALEAILKKHEFDSSKAWSEAKAAPKVSKGESKRQDPRQFVKTFASPIKDKESLFVDLLNWANEHYSDSSPVKTKPAQLEGLMSVGDTATGRLSIGTSEESKVTLRAVDGNWLFVLPEEQYAPSGWNDGFLFGYLDAIHQWRF